jgi:hypothetical protein
MGKKKKDKKSVAKGSGKAQQRKKQKRKLKVIKGKADGSRVERSHVDNMNAPPGFLAVSMSQALMEYSKSIMDLEDSANIEDMNKILQVTSHLWNYGIAVESGDVDKKLQTELLGMIQLFWQVEHSEAQKLLDKFIAKKHEMFPADVQIKGSPMMYMSKVVSHLVAPFNYKQLQLSEEILPPDEKDKIFITKLETIDRYIHKEKDYIDWEEEYFSMEKACNESFSKWLKKKGVSGNIAREFPFLAEIFLNFVYRYMHDDIVVLKSVHTIYFEEFLFDHVLRKVMMEPHEHVDWPPMLKLFYNFLYEKEYLEDSTSFIEVIDGLEPQFVGVLRERFG